MPTWRCPHCGTPQAESSRCWVCKRSSTSCGTCRHFRRAIAGQLGYCGLDRSRQPLRGDELRGCWEGAPPTSHDGAAPDPRPLAPVGERPRLDFVPVETGLGARSEGHAATADGRPFTEGKSRLAPRQPDPVLGLWGEDR